MLVRERLRDPKRRPLLVIVSDCRHTRGADPAEVAARIRHEGIRSVLVDCETGPVRLGLAVTLARTLGAQYLNLHALGDLSAGILADSVRAYRKVA
jgi:magnesium chelatase subunit D